jgi:hypothetical protein
LPALRRSDVQLDHLLSAAPTVVTVRARRGTDGDCPLTSARRRRKRPKFRAMVHKILDRSF